jgi:hypothetical protein
MQAIASAIAALAVGTESGFFAFPAGLRPFQLAVLNYVRAPGAPPAAGTVALNGTLPQYTRATNMLTSLAYHPWVAAVLGAAAVGPGSAVQVQPLAHIYVPRTGGRVHAVDSVLLNALFA